MTRSALASRKSACASRLTVLAALVAVLLLGAAPLGAGPRVEILATGLTGGAPFTVYFAAPIPPELARGVQVEWDFGDGGASRDPGTYHTFVEPGLYSVRLSVRFPDGSVRTSAVQVLTHYGG